MFYLTRGLVGKESSRFVFEGDADEEQAADQDEAEDDQAADETACALDEIDTEETDDIELAWEMLDLARVILSKSKERADVVKLADVRLALGDVSVESGNASLHTARAICE